ncbi:MAG TPA: outer membrane protein assembly factor BamA, partial [Thermohalobaculum sp.]|nr:outer membrane protein assembly factor BamA [Thermohalobaculum sp.]
MHLATWIGCRATRALALGLVFAIAAPQIVPGPANPLTAGQAAAQVADTGTQITVSGNRRIEVATILAYMQLPTDRPVTAEDLNGAVRRLFDTGLFRDVQVIPGPSEVVVQVVENPSINVIAFEGNSKLKDEDLEKIIKLRPRLPFTRSDAEADAQSIIEVYRRLGRYGAQVEPVIIERDENRVDLVFEISEGEVTGISSIDFVGNERFSDRKLRRVIETSESGFLSMLFSGDVYDPDRLELDKQLLRQFYLSRGYADFTVLSATAELTPDREDFFITFTVSEGEEYTFGTMDVQVNARGLDPEEFRAALPDDLEGDTYNANKVEEIANDLTDLAGQRGYAFVQTNPRADKNTEDRVINLTFELDEGSKIFVERIEIEGNLRTLDRVIRRDIELVEGDAFDTRKIRESRSNIRGLGYFRTAEIETSQGSASDRAVLTVKVQEQSTGSLSLGVGFSSSSGVIGNIALTERNFLGRGQIVNAKVTAAGDTQIYNLSFTEPRFLDRDLSVTAAGFFIHDNRTDDSSFTTNSYGIGPRVGFPLAEDLSLSLKYNFVTDNVSTSGFASPLITRDQGKRVTSSVGYELFYDRRDDKLEPTGGYVASFEQDVAGLGGASRYLRSRARAKIWQGFLDDRVVASAEVEGGALVGFGKDTRVTERFFLGGDSLRGFRTAGAVPRDSNTIATALFGNIPVDDALGGNYFAAARFETSFPLGLPEELGVFGGAFVDVGTVWDLDATSYTF